MSKSSSNIKNIGRFIHKILPDGGLKRWLTSRAFCGLYKECLEDFYYRDGVFTAKFHNGIEIKSIKEFDPEPIAHNLWNYPFKKGDVVMDLGGHFGVVASYMALMVGDTGKVLVFEADPANYEILQKNIKLNGIKNVVAINKGVYNKKTVLEFFSGGSYTSSFHKTSYVQKDSDKYEVQKIDVVRLDDEMKNFKIKKLDLIKIDIEGSEEMALEGFTKGLKKYYPNLMVETHIIDGKPTSAGVQRILKKVGYNSIDVTQEGNKMEYIFAKKTN